jgi:hypothetical protein
MPERGRDENISAWDILFTDNAPGAGARAYAGAKRLF